MTKFILSIVILSYLTFFIRCIDNPVIQNGNVNGKVYDSQGMEYYYAFVSVGDYPIICTDKYGNFSAENGTFPYNFTISDRVISTKYIGLTTPAPVVCALKESGNSRYCGLPVVFPMLKNEWKRAILKFISKDPFTQFETIVYPFDDSLKIFDIGILHSKDKITGKLIYLEYTTYSDINVFSYDKFGMKDIVILPVYRNPQIRFTEEDISYNPEERLFYYNINSSNFQDIHSEIFLYFADMHLSSSLQIPYYISRQSDYVLVPVIPRLDYKLKIDNNISFSDNSPATLYSKKWMILDRHENTSFDHYKSISLVHPRDGATDVTDTTKFIFNDLLQGGIYIYNVSNYSYETRILGTIITDKYPLEFRELKMRGIAFRPGTTYYWSVSKYPGYTNIDEFASRKFMEDTTYTSIPASESFSFQVR